MKLFRLLAISALLLFAIGFAGQVHPLFDSLSIGRPIVAGAGFVLAWSFARPTRWIVSGLLGAWLIYFATSFMPSSIQSPNFSLYQHNLLFTNDAPDLKLVAEQQHPDVITLQEIKTSRDAVLTLETHPNKIICEFEAVGDTGILSKYEFVDSGCATGGYRGFAWAQIDYRGNYITIVSVHLHWPFPFSQRKQVDELVPQLEALPRPIIMAGDFNQTNWSRNVSTLADAVDGSPERNTIFTLIRAPLILPIDHVISPFPMVVSKLNRYGSDHNGLMAHFELE